MLPGLSPLPKKPGPTPHRFPTAAAIFTLVLTLLQSAVAYYKPANGERSQLSFRPRGALQVLGIVILGFAAIFVIAGFFA